MGFLHRRFGNLPVPSLKLTSNAPDKMVSQKETRKSSNHPFSGAKMLVSGRVPVMNGVITSLIRVITWVVPPPSKSHHQDYYMFSRESL